MSQSSYKTRGTEKKKGKEEEESTHISGCLVMFIK